jgi:hypothetical protein
MNDRELVAAAASSIYSTPRDMARYLAALLAGGSGEGDPILRPETLAIMFQPNYQTDPRLPGFGLGFYRTDLGGHPAVEHPGILPGFNSQIFLAPDEDVAVMAFTNGARNALTWLTAETEWMLRDLIGAPEDVVRTDLPQRPETWSDLCGWYRPLAQRTDMQARGMAGAGAQVVVRRGRLVVRALSPMPALYRGFPLHPDDDKDPYVFRIDLSTHGLGTTRIVFSQDTGKETTRLHLEVIPLALRKRPAATGPNP